MKIDIQDIKFWADAIRNSEDRDRTLESLWGGQLQSKTWLIETLELKTHISNAECAIFGGWNGVLASMMFNSELGIKHIVLQSNNYYELKEHINCSSSLDQFIKKSNLTDILIAEELQLQKYKRFMIMGTFNV